MKPSRKRLREFTINGPEEALPVPIVGDAAIATKTTAEGRLIPLLILDCSERSDLTEAIRIQKIVASGDVEVVWGKLHGKSNRIALFLRFLRPTTRNVIIEFDVERQGILIESILTANGLYIQPGNLGDRLIHDPNRPKMLIEIPDTGFRPYWDKLYASFLMKRFRREGLGRKEARAAIQEYLQEVRKFVRFWPWR